MTTREHRKAIPLGVKLHAALLALGYTDEEIVGGHLRWDHHPALALRFVDPETGEMTPAPNDPRYIRPMRKDEHDVKTFGLPATTAGSDIGRAAKVKRLTADHEAARRRMLAKDAGEPKQPTRWGSRPFPKRRKASK